MPEFLIYLVFGLGIVTLAGHGIWALIAAMVRSATGTSKRVPEARFQYQDEFEITARRLARLRTQGSISEENFLQVMAALNVDQRNAQPVSPALGSVLLSKRPILHHPRAPAIPSNAETVSRDANEVQIGSEFFSRSVVEDNEGTELHSPPPLPAQSAAPPMARLVAREFRPVVPVPAQPVVPPPPPPPPRKSFMEILSAFMEESNIRWGELIGGLLIVGCSIALVMTFWTSIAERPWLRFFLFTAVTSAVFGAGLYTEHRWKLPTTSRGLLLIATLLVPLNFLAFSRGESQGGAAVMIGEVVAAGLFGWLLWLSGRVLVPQCSAMLLLAVLGPSAVQVLVGHVIVGRELSPATLFTLATLPLLCYCVSTGWLLARLRRLPSIDISQVGEIYILLGLATFAAALAWVIIGYRAGEWLWTFRHLAPLVSAGGMPALASGLFLWRTPLQKESAAVTRTTGLSIAILGALVMLAALILGWPDPARVLPVALLNFAALTFIAVFYAIPAAHVGALACLALAYLLGFHLVLPASHSDHIGWFEDSLHLRNAMLSLSSGSALILLVVLYGATGEWLLRLKRRADAQFYGLSSAGLAVISLAMATVYGFGPGREHSATILYAAYAAISLIVAFRVRRAELT